MIKRLLFFVLFLSSVGVRAQCTVTLSITDTIMCNGDLATLQAISQGGGGWYGYSLEYWSPILGGMWLPLSQQTTYDTATFTSTPASLTDSLFTDYRVVITDSLGCADTSYITVTQPPLLLFSSPTISVDESALGTCDGSISVFVSGGMPPYNYLWTGPSGFTSNNQNINNLCTGNYILTVIDTHGCEIIETVTINLSNPPCSTSNFVVNSVATIDESCCGHDGRIILDIDTMNVGSTLTYSIDTGNTFFPDSILANLTAGNYYVVVKDTNGCDTTLTNVSVSADSIPDIDMSVHITDIVCHGDTNGTFRVLYPDSCYSYTLWRYTISPPYYIPIDTGIYFNGLIPGSYGVIATSNIGNCIDSSSAKVIDPQTPLIQNGIAMKEVRCSTNLPCDGEITLLSAPTGGIPPYYYSILDYGNTIPYGPIGSDSTFSGLCTDSFEVTLFDANACKVIDTVFIPDSTLYIDSIITTNVTCFGYSDGTAIVYAHGGYSPYSYLWSNGYSTMLVDSLSNAQYSVIISDTQNCLTVYDSINVSQPAELFYNIKVIDGFKPETCKGVSHDGEFYMNYQGGTTPFNWSWIGTSGATDSGFGDTIPNLTFDTLTLFVVDSNGCIGQPDWIHADSAKVDALNALNPLILDTIIADSVLCYGAATASIFINIKSGEAAYSYSVDSGLIFTTDSIFTNLPVGNYNIEVRDVFGCSVYDSIIISQATEIIIFWDDTNHVKCYDETTGYIEVHAEGGYSPYQYLWDPSGSLGNIASSLSVGMHTVSVTDAQGCIKVDSLSIVELTLPLTSNAVVTAHASCHDSADGSATISVQGGMPPYTVDWGTGVDKDALTSGSYIITINDSFNCGPIEDTINILHPDEFLIQILSNIPNPCFGDALGELTLTASGGTVPYNKLFVKDGQGQTTMNYVSILTGLSASDYYIWAIDANGCPSDTLKAVKIGEPGEIKINVNNHINSTCFGSDDGILELFLISGTSPYDYNLSENGNTIAQGNANQTTILTFDNLSATQYLLSITDSNNCLKDSVIGIAEPNQVIADFDSDNISGKETFTINLTNNSQGSDVFIWDYDDGNQEILSINDMPIHSYNKQGQYEIMLVAGNSLLSQLCNDTTFVTIDVQGLDVFNVFSPNDDGVNDIFDFGGWSLSSMYVEIYNRWGEKIYHWDSPNGSWNGKTYNDDDAPDGVYYFYLKANGIDGYLYQQQGDITLLR